MTDKELLEAAARASGKKYHYWGNEEHGYIDGVIHVKWNPLEDDGDAFRLMVDLELAVISSKPQTWCESKRGIEAVNHGNDKMAATRRAIVLAAAEMEKT